MINNEEIIESYNEYLSKLPNGLTYIIDSLKNGNKVEALQAIIDFSEGVVWMDDVARHLKANDVAVDFEITAIEQFLEEVNSGLEKADYLLVADIFEYELLEFFSSLSPIKYNN